MVAQMSCLMQITPLEDKISEAREEVLTRGEEDMSFGYTHKKETSDFARGGAAKALAKKWSARVVRRGALAEIEEGLPAPVPLVARVREKIDWIYGDEF